MRHWISGTRLSPALLAALLLLFPVACATVQTTRTLRDAQGAFNDATTAEMQLRAASGETTATLLGARSGGYRTTIGIIDGFDAKQRGELSANKLWGTALMLKAMSQWRLAEYDAAGVTARDATDNFLDQLGPRDAAVLSVLDGLIAIDQANAKLGVEANGVFQCNYGDVEALVESGLATIEAGRKDLSAGVPVQRYLLQAKLAGHRNRQQAEDCNDGGQARSQAQRKAVEKDYCALEAAGEDPKVMFQWRSLLGLQQDVCLERDLTRTQ